jgi:hypothetical protein
VEIVKEYIIVVRSLNQEECRGESEADKRGGKGRRTWPLGSLKKLQYDNIWKPAMHDPKESSAPYPEPIICPPMMWQPQKSFLGGAQYPPILRDFVATERLVG